MNAAFKSTVTKKVILFTNIIAPYNIEYFNGLSEALNGDVLFFFDQITEANRSWKFHENEIRFPFEVKNTWKIERPARGANKTQIFRNIYFPFFIFREVFKLRPELVISVEYGLRTLFALIAATFIGARLVVLSDITPTTETDTGKIKTYFRKFISRLSAAAIARSSHAKEYLMSLNIAEQKIAVAPYAVNFGDQVPIGPDETETDFVDYSNMIAGRTAIVFCGHFNRLKGIDLLMDAVNGLSSEVQRRMVFLMAGGDKQQLMTIKDDFNEDIFVPLGFCSPRELLRLYKSADCMILPTRHDTWGLVVNEAMIAGCPVLVSIYAGCANELVIDGQTGILFNPLLRQEFVEKLIFVHNNKESLKTLSVNASDHVKHFSYQAAVDETVNLLKNLISEKKIINDS